MTYDSVPGALMRGESVNQRRYTDTCDHDPDSQPVCCSCDGEHGGPLYCAWCHGAELAREIQAATAAANAEAAAWRAEAASLRRQLEAGQVQATFTPYLVAVGREGGR